MEYSHFPVFKGTYRYRIDPKGRLPVPAAFRRQLAGAGRARVVLTTLDQCLAVYSPAEWTRLAEKLRGLPSFNRQVKALQRLLASRAVDCALDSQGRILLPPALRGAAGLAREAVVVGVLDRFEIWSVPAWDAFVKDSERLLDDVSLEVPWPLTPGPSPPPLSQAERGASPGRRPQGKPNR